MKKVHYICERCGNPAEIVHHREYINEHNLDNHNILTNHDNLEALCRDCHNKEHFLKDRIRYEFAFDAEGNLVNRK